MKLPAAFLCLLPSAAFACALPPSVILTLPTGYFILGAALTVAMTALVMINTRWLPRMTVWQVYSGTARFPFMATSYLSFVILCALILLGLYGPTDPMHNLLTLIFWTVIWIALPLAIMVFGNLWVGINPWIAPVRLTRVLFGRTNGIGLSAFGTWPAVLGFAGFAWFQIVSIAPDDPQTLAQLAMIYWLIIFAVAVFEGEDWLEQGEFLTVFFRMISRIAPFWRTRHGDQVTGSVGWPGAQIVQMPPLDLSQMAFVTICLAALTFDALSETFFWLGLIGQNPLEFGGRSAVVWVNTAGLLGTWALTITAIWAALKLGEMISGATLQAGPSMLSFLAIAAGYHAAHYFVTLLTAGQFTIGALNDPLSRGDDLLGLPTVYVSFGFLTQPDTMQIIYGMQFLAILFAHLLAVALSLRSAKKNVGPNAHFPMTLLMVGYTVLGLWLLSTARGA
jgi:hypothetical protein